MDSDTHYNSSSDIDIDELIKAKNKCASKHNRNYRKKKKKDLLELDHSELNANNTHSFVDDNNFLLTTTTFEECSMTEYTTTFDDDTAGDANISTEGSDISLNSDNSSYNLSSNRTYETGKQLNILDILDIFNFK